MSKANSPVIPYRLDRSWNSVGLSYEDFSRMCKLAEENPMMRDALQSLKFTYILVDGGRRPDSECYPSSSTSKP